MLTKAMGNFGLAKSLIWTMGEFINELLTLARTKLGDSDVGTTKLDQKYSDAYDKALRQQYLKTLLTASKWRRDLSE